jgi:hypothetical protein
MIDNKLGYQNPTAGSAEEPFKWEFTQGITLGVLTGLVGAALLLAIGYIFDFDHTRDIVQALLSSRVWGSIGFGIF